ncbi:MAG: restriction endonuclease subunit M [Deltaproteobacteria bacterium]|nr:restriction endonuclease subunit M [Deltaproteobacteria bacterium]|tara:strand:+ start:335 stop:2386 length:2052 start_codon:yes stop_codon:yes gene_type:complete
MHNFSEKVNFIWSVADLLRGDYKQSEYGRVILPFTVLRRLDLVLEGTRKDVWASVEKYKDKPDALRHQMALKASGQSFYNTSKLTFETLAHDQIASDLGSYVKGFSQNVQDILEYFRFETQIERLNKANLLYIVVQEFCDKKKVDLSPTSVSNLEMGYIFEELIRKFSEQSNETAGEHFTPREVIRLMVNLLFSEDTTGLRTKGTVRTIFDPACGTGGMLSVAEEYLTKELNPEARLVSFGQELNPESYAICESDLLLKGQDPENIQFGNSLVPSKIVNNERVEGDGHAGKTFDYCLSNPPFGVSWKKIKKAVEKEHEERGYDGRYGAGLPRINDGSLLFLQHMISKMKPVDQGGTRIAIVFNGSPLFTGAAGSGESNIRKWIIENDWLEAIIALPDQMFYNTGINTYIWVVTNRKTPLRKGKVQLINAVDFFQKMRKSLGDKRKELSEKHIEDITELYGDFEEGEFSKIFDNEDFGFSRITVERPLRLNFQASEERIARLLEEKAYQNLAKSKKKKDEKAIQAEIALGRSQQEAILGVVQSLDPDTVYKDREVFLKDLKAKAKGAGVKFPASLQKSILNALSERDETAEVCLDKKNQPEPDTTLRDYENVPLKEDIDAYMEREVLPHVPDAWVDYEKTKVGYEIPFTRHFYLYTPPRPLEDIDAEIRQLESELQGMLAEVLG